MIASCPNEGEDFYRVPYTPESLKELKDLHLWTYCSHSCAFVTGYVVRPAVFPASLKGKGPVPPGAGPRFISAGKPWPLSRIR